MDNLHYQDNQALLMLQMLATLKSMEEELKKISSMLENGVMVYDTDEPEDDICEEYDDDD